MKILNKILNLIKLFWYNLTSLPYKYIKLNRPIFNEEYEKSFLTIFTGLFIGIFFISLIIWNRLIREYLPRVIELEVFTIKFYIILAIFLFFFMRVIINSNKLIKNWRKIEHKPNKIILMVLEKISQILENNPKLNKVFNFMAYYIGLAPLYLWRFLFFNIPLKRKLPLMNILYRLGMRLCKMYFVTITEVPFLEKYTFNEKTLYKITLILLVYLPRIITFSVYFYEVVIKKELNYFYSIAVILVIPIIFFCLRRMLHDLGYFEILRVEEEYIKVVSKSEATEDHPLGLLEEVDKHDWVSDEDFAQAWANYEQFRLIYLLAYDFYKESKKYDYIASLIVDILLAISFGYWLYQIF